MKEKSRTKAMEKIANTENYTQNQVTMKVSTAKRQNMLLKSSTKRMENF